MAKIAVLGGAGYVGSFTAQKLAKSGFSVVVIDDLSSGHKVAVGDLPLVKLDILTEKEKLTEVFRKEKIETVFHFAALIQMGESMEKPELYFRHNVLGSLNALEAAKEAGVSSFIFSSTAGVYGDPEKLPIPEEHKLAPTNPYGESKVMIEKMLYWYWQVHKLPSVSLRYFNAAGAAPDGSLGEDHPNESHLIPLVARAVLKGEPVTIFGKDYKTPDGTCIRDYIHVLDLVEVHIKAMEYLLRSPGVHAFNVGAGLGHSNLAVLRMVEKVSGKKATFDFGARRAGDATELVADIRRARRVLGFQPKLSSLEEIVRTAWLWHAKHPQGFGV